MRTISVTILSAIIIFTLIIQPLAGGKKERIKKGQNDGNNYGKNYDEAEERVNSGKASKLDRVYETGKDVRELLVLGKKLFPPDEFERLKSQAYANVDSSENNLLERIEGKFKKANSKNKEPVSRFRSMQQDEINTPTTSSSSLLRRVSELEINSGECERRNTNSKVPFVFSSPEKSHKERNSRLNPEFVAGTSRSEDTGEEYSFNPGYTNIEKKKKYRAK